MKGCCCCCISEGVVVKMPNARNVANRCVNFVTIGEFIIEYGEATRFIRDTAVK